MKMLIEIVGHLALFSFPIWCTVTGILIAFLVLCLHGNVANEEIKPWKLSIKQPEKMDDKISRIIRWFSVFCITLIVLLILMIMGLLVVEGIFTTILTVALFPFILDRISEQANWKTYNKFIMLLLGIPIGIIVKCREEQKWVFFSSEIDELIIIIILSIYISYVSSWLVDVFSEKKKEISGKDIHKDLFWRTPQLNVLKQSIFDVLLECESAYGAYFYYLHKNKKIKSIQFDNAIRVHKELWYGRVMKIFRWCYSISLIGFTIGIFSVKKEACRYGIYILFGILIVAEIYMTHFEEAWIRTILRVVYGEWGCVLHYVDKKSKSDRYDFIGHVPLFSFGKHHRLVKSMMNIAALGRAIAYRDRVTGSNDMCKLTNNVYELLLIEDTGDSERTLLNDIPLWIIMMFEYNVSQKIVSNSAKEYLQGGKTKKEEVRDFLLGFWSDVTRMSPDDQFIDDFIEEVYKN